MRQVAPISPAIHLGADKLFVGGVGRMSSIFLDSLWADLECTNRINNRTLGLLPEQVRRDQGMSLRPIEVL